MNCFTFKFLFPCTKTIEGDKKIESSQSEQAVQPKYLERELSQLLGNCI